MREIPATYLFIGDDENALRNILPEFAANGAKHVVLSDLLVSAIMHKYAFADTVQKYLDETGLTFVDSHAPFGWGIDMNSPVKSRRRENILRQKLALNIAQRFNVAVYALTLGRDAVRSKMVYNLRHFDNMLLIGVFLKKIL